MGCSINVLVAGLPGKTATEVTKQLIESKQFYVLPVAFTGESLEHSLDYQVSGKNFVLIRPNVRNGIIHEVKRDYPDLVVLDFTHPDSAVANGRLYNENGLPFLMGTTFNTTADKKELESYLNATKFTLGGIVSNFALPIAGFQQVLKDFAVGHKDCLRDAGLYILESHQGPDIEFGFKGKADASGTADDVRQRFNYMGIPYTKERINLLRHWDDQKRLLNLEENCKYGHAYHKYRVYDFKANPVITELSDALTQYLVESPVFKNYLPQEFPNVPEGRCMVGKNSADKSVQFGLWYNSYKNGANELIFAHLIKGRSVYGTMAVEGLKMIHERFYQNGEKGLLTGIDILERVIEKKQFLM